MKKLIAIALLLAAPYSWAATIYYVGAQGSTGNSCSDSNAGTSKVNPWCHAPGMPAATGTASSTTPGAGDSVILRGGDTWHYVVNSPDANDVYVGSGSWNIGYGGTATTCNFDVTSGAVIRTSCTYIGTDQTFYNATVCGASFCRPILTMDNATTTAYVGSCTHNNTGLNGLNINHSFVQLDDFEFTGMCTQGSAASQTGTGAPMVEFSNNYYHGWSSTGAQGNAVEGGCGGGGCTGFVLIDHNVLDGSDSSGASTAYSGNQTGFQVCTDWEYNVLRYVGNNCVENSGQSSPHQIHIFHDNLFEYDYNVGHGNIIEMCSGSGLCNSFGDVYFWGNMTRHVAQGVTYDFIPASGGNVYAFGDIYFDIGNGSNCLGPNGNGAGSTITAYVVNSTFDFQTNSQGGSTGGCKVAGGSPITVTFENNHFINYQTSGSAPGGMVTTPNCVGNNTTCSGYLASIYGGTLTDSGGEVWQSETTANAQGPTGCQGTPTCSTGNNYQPTSTSGTTYHAGNNLTSFCNSLPVAIAATACGLGSSGGVTEISGQGGMIVGPTLVASPPSRSTTPDAGAYQFSGSSTPPVAPLPFFAKARVIFSGEGISK